MKYKQKKYNYKRKYKSKVKNKIFLSTQLEVNLSEKNLPNDTRYHRKKSQTH